MPTRVLLLRHAETTHPHMYNGAESDIDLSDHGRRQAEALAPVIAARAPEFILSSAMRRAVQTAEILVAVAGTPHLLEPSLHERYVGIFSGKTHEEVAPLWRDTVRRWIDGEVNFAQEGAESLAGVRQRILPVWERVTRHYEGRTIVIVAHGNILKILLLTILSEWSIADWDRFGPIPNLALTELLGSPASGWETLVLNQLDPVVQAVNACRSQGV